MRAFVFLLTVCIITACTPAPTPAEREAAFQNDLHRLVQVSLTDRLRPKLAASYRSMVAPRLPADLPGPQTPEQIAGEEIDEVLEMKMADLEKRLAAVFAARFTPEEVKQLLAFHESPLGRKSQAVSAEMAEESRAAMQEWSQVVEQALNERLKIRFAKAGVDF